MNARERFLNACRRLPVDRTPVWFMRQAGRVLPEYRRLKERYEFLQMARNPELITEVTLMPFKYLDVDAAIIFSDIMIPFDGLGIDYTIEKGVGPIVAEPVRSLEQVKAFRPFHPEEQVGYLLEGLRMVRRELKGERALLGFAGAPFTLACYLIEGRPSRDFARAKQLMYSEPDVWHGLMDALTSVQVTYLRAQIDAGADAVQLFDSWVGGLGPDDYREYVFPYMQRLFSRLQETGVPTIHFGTGTATLLDQMAAAGGDVIGLDWRVPIDEGWERVGFDRAVQGNLDPHVLLGPFSKVEERATAILDRVGNRDGHIFNLGHGVVPDASLDHLRRLVDWVHEKTERGGS